MSPKAKPGRVQRLSPRRFSPVLILALTASLVAAAWLARGYVPSVAAAAGDVDTTFNAGVFNTGTVLQMARQLDGKVIVAGRFPIINGVPRNRIARLNADGTLDTSFNPAPEIINDISALALQPDGEILIGGNSVIAFNVPGVVQGNADFGRLNADGSLDTAFYPGITNSSILAIEVLPDGKILVGGAFTQWFTPGGFTSKTQLVRVNADGSLDNSFITDILAPLGTGVWAMAVQPDGRILIAGNFNGLSGGAGSHGNPRLARLNSNGTADTSGFDVGTGPTNCCGLSSLTNIFDVALQPDGRIVIGGLFDSFNGTARKGFARLNADGSLDTSFVGPGVSQGQVFAVALQPDGKVLIGGDDGADTNPSGRFRRFNTDGSLDTPFDPGGSTFGFTGSVFAIALEPNGKILAAGRFSRYRNEGHSGLARVNVDGSVDSTYTAGAFVVAAVREIAFQPDGKILIGGDFLAVNGTGRTNMARLNADGSLDPTFATDPFETNNTVRAIYVLPDGKILVGGNFGRRMVRLNADGSRDTTFNVNGGLIDLAVWDIVRQPNGQILVGGEFTYRIARLSADGATDQQFIVNIGISSGANNTVRSVLLQPDGKILLAGHFSTFKTVSRPGLERLNSNGLPDSSFTPGLPAGLNDSIALQTDGKVIVGGRDRVVNSKRVAMFRVNSDGSLDNSFDTTTWLTFGSNAFADVTEVAALANGKVLFGGTFIVNSGSAGTSQRVYRVLADGSPDNSFTSVPGGDGAVLSFAMQPDGKLIVGGQFTTYNSQQHFGLGRLLADGGPTPTPTPTPTPDFIVNSINDPGTGVCDVTECTFREAITAANAKPGREAIAFNIPGSGVRTISFTNLLPQINSEVVIDGYTQPGASPNTLSVGDNAVLLIELAGPLGGNNGLAIAGANSVVKGLVINRLGNGITLFSNDNVVQGNFIGTDATGTLDRGNRFDGVGIFGGSFNLIGGTNPAARNIISGNEGKGVTTNFGAAEDNVVVGNLIGTQADGVSPLGNTQQGVLIGPGTRNTVGGLGSGAGNVIAFNGGNAGVSISSNSTNNAILGNSIFSNAGLGINLGADGAQANDSCDSDAGSNELQNFPVLTSANSTVNSTTIQGTLNSTASKTFRVEFFANSACGASGLGEGKTFIGSTTILTDPSCNASINVTLPTSALGGQVIVATATDSNNNSSEFSQCVPVTGATPAPTPSPSPTPSPTPTPTPTVQFSASSYSVGEGDGFKTITVERTGNTSQAVTVDYASSDHSNPADFIPCTSPGVGFASSRCDFTTAVGTLRFAAGETSKTFNVLISQDNYVEGPETLSLTLSNLTGGAVFGVPSTAILSITDDPTEPATNAVDNASDFVRSQYHDFLAREPDGPGLAFWTDNIEKCNDPARRPAGQTVAQCIDKQRESTAIAFFMSPEFQITGGFVYHLYKGSLTGSPNYDGGSSGLLGRFPTSLEFTRDVRQVSEGIVVNNQIAGAVVEANRNRLAAEFVQRPEFVAKYGGLNHTLYVQELFNTTGIVATAGEKQALVDGLANGTETLASVLRKVVDGTVVISEGNVQFTTTYGQAFYNQEYRRVFVFMEYVGYLRRNPDAPGFIFWLGKLNQYNGDPFLAEMVRSFILSPEYRSRFGQP